MALQMRGQMDRGRILAIVQIQHRIPLLRGVPGRQVHFDMDTLMVQRRNFDLMNLRQGRRLLHGSGSIQRQKGNET